MFECCARGPAARRGIGEILAAREDLDGSLCKGAKTQRSETATATFLLVLVLVLDFALFDCEDEDDDDEDLAAPLRLIRTAVDARFASD